MKTIHSIFVEGVADKRFIEQLIEHLFGDISECINIINTDGCSNLTSPKKQTTYINQMKRTSADNGVNLVIFDADDDYDKKRNELVKWKDQNNLDFQLFLFPDNNSSGELEDLLENIINPENKPVMDCWKTYENSLKNVDLPWRNGQPLTIPAKKTKIYAYLEVLLGASETEKKKIKERERNYLDCNHWNMDAEAMSNLIDFLKTNLSQKLAQNEVCNAQMKN